MTKLERIKAFDSVRHVKASDKFRTVKKYDPNRGIIVWE
jgi:hypothetical protein